MNRSMNSAQIFPRYPHQVESQSAAERKLYELFKAHLPAPYVVIHSVALREIQGNGQLRDREVDFIIADPRYGVVSVEVKGGRIEVRDGLWYTTDRNGVRAPIKSPIQQVQDAAYDLRRFLSSPDGAPGFEWSAWYAVALPDVDVERRLDPSLAREITLDRSDLQPEKVAAAIARVFAYQSRGKQWINGGKAIQALRRVLVPEHYLRSMLSTEILEEERRVKELTDHQREILNEHLRDHRRSVITGVAGSGKTMIAVEIARQLAESGTRVLYTCFNFNLASTLAARHEHPNIHFRTYHQLCREVSGEADWSDTLGIKKERYYDGVLPSALLEAAERSETARYGAIIVDEGQDFKQTFWPGLLALLQDKEKSRFYIFCDDNQRLYSQDRLPFDKPTKHLRRNLRNALPIGNLVKDYHRSPSEYEAAGPEAEETRVMRSTPTKDQTEAEVLASTLEYVIGEGILPSQIVILSPFSGRSKFKDGDLVGNFRLRRALEAGPDEIRLQTVHGFKGLEAPVVILVEMARARYAPADLDELLYVGLSRAKNLLVIIGDLPTPDEGELPEES
jgi:hypothetical protein